VPPSTAAWMPAASSESEPPRNPERAEETERLFRRELRSSRLEGEWYLLDERDMRELVEYANASDLTILGQESSEAPGDGFSPDAVIVEVGRPVLIVPYAGKFEMVGLRALIAWDGSREAARALGDALPLIESANVVTVVYVGAGERELERAQPRLDRIVRHLQRHAVKATAEETPRGDIAISDLFVVARRRSRGRSDCRGRLSPFATARGVARRGQPRIVAARNGTGADVALSARLGLAFTAEVGGRAAIR
jgi:hypothetical protein